MAAITAPFSLELTADEDAREATAGTVSTVVLAKMKIFLEDTVGLTKHQSINGSLRNCFRLLMAEVSRRDVSSDDQVASGNYLTASAGNITLDTDLLSIAVGDVVLIVSGTFGSSAGKAQTHMFTETFNQLMDVLSERLAQN